MANSYKIYLAGRSLFVILSTCFSFAAENVLIEKVTFLRKLFSGKNYVDFKCNIGKDFTTLAKYCKIFMHSRFNITKIHNL